MTAQPALAGRSEQAFDEAGRMQPSAWTREVSETSPAAAAKT